MQATAQTTTKLPGRGTPRRKAQAASRWLRRIAQRQLQAAGQYTQAALATTDANRAATLRSQARQALGMAETACAAAQQALANYRATCRQRAAASAAALLPTVPATMANLGLRACLMAKAALQGARKAQAAKTTTAQPAAKQPATTRTAGAGAGARGGYTVADVVGAMAAGVTYTTPQVHCLFGVPTVGPSGRKVWPCPNAAALLQAALAQGKVTGYKQGGTNYWQRVS